MKILLIDKTRKGKRRYGQSLHCLVATRGQIYPPLKYCKIDWLRFLTGQNIYKILNQVTLLVSDENFDNVVY